MSGPVGGTLFFQVKGIQVWVRYINERGGVNGHQVRLNLYDDSGDPARHQAQVRQAVEKDRAIALVQNIESVTGESSVDYLTSKRIPVIGSDTGASWYYRSPMYFPQASSAEANWRASLVSLSAQVIPEGKTKLGYLVCVEAKGCDEFDRVATQLAPSLGFDVVYRAKGSVAQPDFTAECLAARNAGAQVFFILIDTNTFERITTSCARQGYRPVYSYASVVAVDRHKDDPNLQGLVATSSVFPYFQTGTPATDQYHQAMQRYGSDIPPGGGPPSGWVTGKLLERATINLPEPPTSEAILRGLWTIRGEDLGGLTQPLSFIENQAAPSLACGFIWTISNKAWVSPDRFTRHCEERRP